MGTICVRTGRRIHFLRVVFSFCAQVRIIIGYFDLFVMIVSTPLGDFLVFCMEGLRFALRCSVKPCVNYFEAFMMPVLLALVVGCILVVDIDGVPPDTWSLLQLWMVAEMSESSRGTA